MANSTRPTILLVSVGFNWVIKDFEEYGRPFDKSIKKLLATNALVVPAPTYDDALWYLANNDPPHGILVTDPGVTEEEGKELLGKLVTYVRSGGTLVLSLLFSGHVHFDVVDVFWRDTWGQAWKSGSYQRRTVELNENVVVPAGGTQLAEAYSQKALSLKNVAPRHSLYRPVRESDDDSDVSAPTAVEQTETPVVFAQLGEGRLGYTGDVNMEEGTQDVVLRMFGL